MVLGVKVKLTVQLAPAASWKPQVLDCPNRLAYVPEIPKLNMNKDALPVFSTLTVCAELVVLTVIDPNETAVTEMPATPPLWAAENPTVAEADISASAVRVARRIPAF